MKLILPALQILITVLLALHDTHAAEPTPVDFTVKLETVMKHDDGKFLWFHPRAAAIPGRGDGGPAVVMTIQKHLKISDYYSGLHVMTRPLPTAAWTGPVLPPELDWRPQPDGVTISVADVTPGWHAPTGKLLAIGCQVRYSPKGQQLDDMKRAHQTVYAVFDPKTERWTPWQVLEMPPDEEFDFARNACSQWLVRADGKLLVPLYIGRNSKVPASVTVAECRFDGAKLAYVRHGTVLRLNVVRGLSEPSLIAFRGRYFLTLRNDLRGYVTASDDGLQFPEQQPWLFDDGAGTGQLQHAAALARAQRRTIPRLYAARGEQRPHHSQPRAALHGAGEPGHVAGVAPHGEDCRAGAWRGTRQLRRVRDQRSRVVGHSLRRHVHEGLAPARRRGSDLRRTRALGQTEQAGTVALRLRRGT